MTLVLPAHMATGLADLNLPAFGHVGSGACGPGTAGRT